MLKQVKHQLAFGSGSNALAKLCTGLTFAANAQVLTFDYMLLVLGVAQDVTQHTITLKVDVS